MKLDDKFIKKYLSILKRYEWEIIKANNGIRISSTWIYVDEEISTIEQYLEKKQEDMERLEIESKESNHNKLDDWSDHEI